MPESKYSFQYIQRNQRKTSEIKTFIDKLDIFPLMCAADKVWITELTLIHKNIRLVHNCHWQVNKSIWRKTCYDVTDKNNNISSEATDIITNISVSPILVIISVVSPILVIISVSTFKIAFILYVSESTIYNNFSRTNIYWNMRSTRKEANIWHNLCLASTYMQ